VEFSADIEHKSSIVIVAKIDETSCIFATAKTGLHEALVT